MKRLFYLVCCCMVFCTNVFAVYEETHFESYGEVDLRGATFTILPADESISQNDPKFTWFAQQTAPYFELRGAYYVTSVQDAELVLLLDYGIGETTPRIYNKPIWGSTGISSSTTTIRGNKISTTYTPSSGVIGYQQKVVNQYRKHIELYLYDSNTTDGMSLLWQAFFEMVGATNNLKMVYPAMMYHIGCHGYDCSIGRAADLTAAIFDYYWNPEQNLIMDYASHYIVQNDIAWRKLWPIKTELTQKTDQQQRKKECVIIPTVIVQNENSARVYFNVLAVEVDWKLSNLSNLFIEYKGQRYYALSSIGLKNNKKLSDYNQRTFVIDFEALPKEMQHGYREFRLIEEKKGKILQGWDLWIEQE